MTTEEAIKELKHLSNKSKVINSRYDLIEIHFHYNSDFMDVIDKSITALEKQIPKKPMLEADGYYNGELVYDTWVCPSCGTRYETDYDEHLYCPHCGQAISFEEVEE